MTTLYAARKGNFKAHYIIEGAYGQFEEMEVLETPLLFDLSEDSIEKYNNADEHPDVLTEIEVMFRRHKEKLVEVNLQFAECKAN